MATQKFITIENGEKKLKSSIDVSTGVTDAGKIIATDSTGKLPSSMLPLGLGSDTYTLPASEVILANSLVSIWSDAGVTKVRNAIANTVGKEAIGYAKIGGNIGDSITVFLEGEFDFVGSVVGTDYFLSDSNAGQPTSTAPSASGSFIQSIGMCYDSGKIRFEEDDSIYID